MTSKFTPGPWKVCYGTATEHYIRPEKTAGGIAGLDHKTPYSAAAFAPLAKVLIEDEGFIGFNANLIAAAPDLLHAVKLTAAWLREHCATESGKQYAGYLTALERAIAKAEGAPAVDERRRDRDAEAAADFKAECNAYRASKMRDPL